MSLVVPFAEIFEHKRGVLTNHHSWERTELGMVCEVLNGFPFKSPLFNKSKGFPVIRIRDLSKGKTETFFNGKFPSEYVINNGDLLIGMDGIFRCVEWRGGKAGLNQRVCKIIPNEKYLDRKFLLAGLNGYLKAIEDATSSVTVGHLSSRDILRIPFPVPPLAEQRRIVARLEALLGKVDACQRRLDRIPVLLKRFRQSLLSAACSGRLTADWRENDSSSAESQHSSVLPVESEDRWGDLPDGWQYSTLGTMVESLKYGTSKKCEYTKTGYPVLRIPNIGDRGLVDASDMKYAELPSGEYRQLRLKTGDILLIRSNGSVTLVGRTAIVRKDEEGFAYAGYLIRLRINPKTACSSYLNLALASSFVRDQIEIPIRSTSGVNNINSNEVKNLIIPYPPIPEQHEIVHRVNELLPVADQIEARYANAKAYVDKMTQSILAKAFRGELVPQDENDEPASALLERICALRASAVATASATRKSLCGVAASAVRAQSMPPAHRGRLPKAAPPTPAPHGSTGKHSDVPLSRAALEILKSMEPGRDYARADLADSLGLSVAEWNSGINELKDARIAMQTGERRGARYRKTVERGQAHNA